MTVKKHKITATIQWDMELPDSYASIGKLSKSVLESILPSNFGIRILNINHPKKTNIKLGEFSLEDVFSKLNLKEKVEFTCEDKTYMVSLASQRYFVFKENPKCVACGLQGNRFVLEKHPNDLSPHFNLYGEENGSLVLFTKDHILAKSKGGSNRYDNYETMCIICNNLKADCDLNAEQVAELRNVWNECEKLPRKERSRRIKSAMQVLKRTEIDHEKVARCVGEAGTVPHGVQP